MNQQNKSGERRRNRRVLFDAPANLQTEDGVSYQTLLIDISLKGALTKIPANWPASPEQPITLNIHLDEDDAVISMQCHLIHTEGEAIGFHCHSMDMDSITHLRRLVELNLGDPELLERELATLG
jgi:hypothetical protein